MAAPRWQRAKGVFQAAMTRAPDARAAFLAEACGGDGDLRREVEALVAAHDAAGDFLLEPAARAAHPGADTPAVPSELRRVGPYRILAAIGQGGMGAVYRAVRDDDAFQKTVALKLVRGGLGSESLERRFRQERQILARLQHPNIATVLDGGTIEDGQPYLVMEHVAGRPITEDCEAHGLGTKQRLALFRLVCGAVHYAHQNLVVHRDIKPANVLIDENGVPKLLDFGIAKLLASGVDPDEAPTATMLPMMTPEYASPEQVKGQPVTTASDVYSLGVLLYELLAGRRPYEVKTDSLEAIVQAVCQTDPKAPSQAAGEAAAGQRSTGSPQPSELRGDLDTIVLKALRKEPARRYPSAHELSEDIRRHLDGLPVTARADTLGYRAGKFVRRHRAAAVAVTLVVGSLAAGIVMTIREGRIADANRRRAEHRFEDVRKLAKFVMFDMYDAIVNLPGSTPARRQLVEKALEYLDALAAEPGTDPALRSEIAAGYRRLSGVQGDVSKANLGDPEAALRSLRKAVALREELAAGAAAGSGPALELAEIYSTLGRTLLSRNRADEGRAVLHKAGLLLDAVPEALTDDDAVLRAGQQYYFTLSVFNQAADDWTAYRESRRGQLDAAQRLAAKDPTGLMSKRDFALALKYYGGALTKLSEWQEARDCFEKALAIDREVLALEGSPRARLDLSFSYGSIGMLLRETGDLDGAATAYGEALKLVEEVHHADPNDAFAVVSLVRDHQWLTNILALKGDLAGVLVHQGEAMRLRKAWQEKHPSVYSEAAWAALRAADLGDREAALAARADAPVARQRDHWRAARAAYARSLASWLELEKSKPLEADLPDQAQRLRDAIARSDAALARLGAPSAAATSAP